MGPAGSCERSAPSGRGRGGGGGPTSAADPREFVVLLLDAAVDGVVEAAVGHHEVGHDLGVVDVGQQVEGHPHGQRGEELGELGGGLRGDDDVVHSVEKADRRNSGRVERDRGFIRLKNALLKAGYL